MDVATDDFRYVPMLNLAPPFPWKGRGANVREQLLPNRGTEQSI